MIRQRVSVELLKTIDPEERGDVLIAALYEVSNSVLPLLGSPSGSREYLDRQAAVLDLITFVAIPLVRGRDRRGVAVLAEIAEGCLDPLLRKKLTVYAHELLAKSNQCQPAASTPQSGSRSGWLLAAFAVAVLVLFFVWPRGSIAPTDGAAGEVDDPAATPSAEVAPAVVYRGAPPAPPEAGTAPAQDGVGGALSVERGARAERIEVEPAGAAAPGEQVTRVRIVNNQVMVPVLLKNGSESVALELVLDTGSTRTVLHDGLASRLQIDLRQSKGTMSEVADGRMIRSRLARIDALAVGPFVMAPAEIELITFNGAEGSRDGLLGMDFLGKHRYQIDMERELIRWF